MSVLADEHNDTDTSNFLKLWLPSALNAAQFFSVLSTENQTQIALFGDVSPDCDPEWLEDILSFRTVKHQKQNFPSLYEAKKISGWVKLMYEGFPKYFEKQTLNHVNKISNTEEYNPIWQFCDEAGWYRLDYGKWTAIFHAQSSSGKSRASHAHNDLCSIVLYHDGLNVFCDPGRLDYVKGSLYGEYALSAKAHNSMCVDGFDPMLSNRNRMLPKSYRKSAITYLQFGDGVKSYENKNVRMLLRRSINWVAEETKELKKVKID